MRNFMKVIHSMEKGYMTTGEASRYRGVKPSTIRNWAKEGKIPHYKVGKMQRFKREKIDAWMENQGEDGTVVDKRAKSVLEIAKSQKPDVDGVVRKAIEEMRKSSYTGNNGNQTKVKGLGEEVKNGNL